jgi:hypothetical protein
MNEAQAPSIGTIKVYLGDTEIKQIMRIEADDVIVSRNQRKVNATSRVYQ